MSKTGKKKKRIVYHAPPLKAVDSYAKKVCQELGNTRDASYNNPTIVHGFAAFVELATAIWAKHLTKESEEKVAGKND